MLTIIFKIILCSSIFIGVYYLFLEKEKMYRFNRFYLLSAIILAYAIPFITIPVQTPETEAVPRLVFNEVTQQLTLMQPAEQESFNWMNIIGLIYVSVAFYLLINSVLAILEIKRIQGRKHVYENYNILLTKDNRAPFSFWKTIYLGENYIKNGHIDPRIFLHEKSHLDQKHSLDLILIDLLKIVTWFNPLLFLYKKAIVTNHEFLADESVLSNRFNIKEYQNLILEEILSRQNPTFTHSFNFNNTKKRFIMMKAKQSKFSTLRKTMGITVFLAAAAFFSEKTYAGTFINSSASEGIERNYFQIPTVNSRQESKRITSEYPDELNNENKVQKEEPASLMELKKENFKTVSDTISPKKTAQTGNEEGKNTNINVQANQDYTEAQYPEGLKSLRTQIGKKIDLSNIDPLKGSIASMAYIHIDETGKATRITTSGNNENFNKEFLKTITDISNETAWKPATKDGKTIASVLKIPATMTFERK